MTDIYREIDAERRRAHAKHGPKSMESAAPHDMKRLRILMEEVGEVAREFNEADIADRPLDLVATREELIQVAAMAAAWAESCGPTSAPQAEGDVREALARVLDEADDHFQHGVGSGSYDPDGLPLWLADAVLSSGLVVPTTTIVEQVAGDTADAVIEALHRVRRLADVLVADPGPYEGHRETAVRADVARGVLDAARIDGSDQ